MEIAVIGKHPSVETYPPDVFNSFTDTLGLNHAALTFSTRFAFWMQINIGFYREFYKGEKIITVPKGTNARYVRDHCFEEVSYEHDATTIDVTGAVKNAVVLKNPEYNYTSVNTCLHVALFWCLHKDYKSIHLFGCNNEPVPGGKEWNWEVAARVTQQIIDEANRYQIRIHWWKDYDQFQALAHKLGCLSGREAVHKHP